MSEYKFDLAKVKADFEKLSKSLDPDSDPFAPVASGMRNEGHYPGFITLKKCGNPKIVGDIKATKEEKMAMFMGSIAESFKKTSEERKYCDKLIKNFEGMNMESIKFFITSNYDRFDEIRTMIKKYDDNFDEKETARYEARYTVLSKAMVFMLQENL